MTLTIKIKNLEYDEAADLTKAVTEKVQKIENDRPIGCCELKPPEPQVSFEYDEDAITCRAESTTFSRYIAGTKKE